MPNPTVSIIINCYNGQKYLREALESICNQTFKDWELVFWDNGSTDSSAAIVLSYEDSRFRYFLADRHTGLGEARNMAVSRTCGTWLAFLDCDDLWHPEKLSRQLDAAASDERVGLVYGPVHLLIADKRSPATSLQATLARRSAKPHPAREIYDVLLEGNFIVFSTVLVRRSLFEQAGGIDIRLIQNEDYDLLVKTSLLCKAVCIRGECASYRIHASNNSHVQEERSYLENMLIYDALPQDQRVDRARRINASKHAMFQLRQRRLLKGVGTLISAGSISWTLKRIIARAFTLR